MKCNGLKCRCGDTESWELQWAYTGQWELSLICNICGAVYKLGNSENEHAKTSKIAHDSWEKNQEVKNG